LASKKIIAKSSWTAPLVSVLLVLAIIDFAKGVLIPLTLAALLSFLSPICGWIERRGISRMPAVLLTRFIRYLGPWIAEAIPVGLSLAILTDWAITVLRVGAVCRIGVLKQ